MSTITYQRVADHLEKLKTIYETLQIPKKEIKEVEKIIELFHGYGDISVEEKTGKANIEKKSNKTTKPSFSDIVDSLFEEKYSGLVGTKLHFTKLNTVEQIITYIDATAKTKVMKEATALDLKLLYCLLTEEKQEIKGTKNEVYEAIKRDIRTKRRGKAFLEYA
ncbi:MULTISPECIES: hypothetical protein [unclassified Fredinandcohnia]|uniref:hypothetical protein n=1 Tax=unclassified Fredinandcohnia TaxID=2837514 RepID=UPI0030FDDE50